MSATETSSQLQRTIHTHHTPSHGFLRDSRLAQPDGEPYEFAWLLLDWRSVNGGVPRVLVTTSDDWGEERMVKSPQALKLKIG